VSTFETGDARGDGGDIRNPDSQNTFSVGTFGAPGSQVSEWSGGGHHV